MKYSRLRCNTLGVILLGIIILGLFGFIGCGSGIGGGQSTDKYIGGYLFDEYEADPGAFEAKWVGVILLLATQKHGYVSGISDTPVVANLNGNAVQIGEAGDVARWGRWSGLPAFSVHRHGAVSSRRMDGGQSYHKVYARKSPSPAGNGEGPPCQFLGWSYTQPCFFTKSDRKGTSTHSPWYALMARTMA